MGNNDIIELLQDHFEERVAQEIRPSTVTNVNDLVILLKRIESTRNKKPYEGDLYKVHATNNASRYGSRTSDSSRRATTSNNTRDSIYRKGGQRDNENVDRNTNPNPRYAEANQTRSYPSAFRNRYNNGQRFAYPRKDGRSTVTITEVRDEEPETATNKSTAYKKPAIGWTRGQENRDDDKPKNRNSRDTGYRDSDRYKKRIAAIAEEEEGDDESEQRTKEKEKSSCEPKLNILRTKRILEDLDESMEEAHKAKKWKEWEVPIITVEFKNVKIKALVDTGAQVSALTKELYEELQSKGEKMAVLPIKRFLLREIGRAHV